MSGRGRFGAAQRDFRRLNRLSWRARLSYGLQRTAQDGAQRPSVPPGRGKGHDPKGSALEERVKAAGLEYRDHEIDYEDLRYYPESPS